MQKLLKEKITILEEEIGSAKLVNLKEQAIPNSLYYKKLKKLKRNLNERTKT